MTLLVRRTTDGRAEAESVIAKQRGDEMNLRRWLGFAGREETPAEARASEIPAAPVEEVVREQVFNPAAFAQSLIDEDRGWRSLISGGMRELPWALIMWNIPSRRPGK